MDKLYDFSILRHLRKRENLNIAELSERSTVSAAVISKLERNCTTAELDTIYKLARVFGINASELLALAEKHSASRTSASRHSAGGFTFSQVNFNGLCCQEGKGKKGSRLSRPEIHGDDYEMCWVLEGALSFMMTHQECIVKAGEAVNFDALLEHTYEAIEDCRIIIVRVAKRITQISANDFL